MKSTRLEEKDYLEIGYNTLEKINWSDDAKRALILYPKFGLDIGTLYFHGSLSSIIRSILFLSSDRIMTDENYQTLILFPEHAESIAFGLLHLNTISSKKRTQQSFKLFNEEIDLETQLSLRIYNQVQKIKQNITLNKEDWAFIYCSNVYGRKNIPYHEQKYIVLIVLAAHLSEYRSASSLISISDTLKANPNYDKGGLFRSDTGSLVDEVLAFQEKREAQRKLSSQRRLGSSDRA